MRSGVLTAVVAIVVGVVLGVVGLTACSSQLSPSARDVAPSSEPPKPEVYGTR
jgi:hypothetical protein